MAFQNKKKNTELSVHFKGMSGSDIFYYSIAYIITILLVILVLYPLIYIVSASFSSPTAVASGAVKLLPVDFSLIGYRAVFQYSDVFIGYRNTLFYTIVGTFINVCMTTIAAYALSRKGMPGRNLFTFIFSFTMIFSGGLIPTYILIRDLKMINTVWSMLIPGAISVVNLIITRTFIQTNVPGELLESSKIDGCSDFRFFFKIVLPLSKTVLAVITLYYAVGHWNSYFNAFLYLSDKRLYPLQLFLREILILHQFSGDLVTIPELEESELFVYEVLKYSLIVVSTAPILCMYPFVQRYFEKGVLIGSLKG